MPRELTRIWVSKGVRDGLKSLGRKGDTYDDIITKLLAEHSSGDGASEPPSQAPVKTLLRPEIEELLIRVSEDAFSSPAQVNMVVTKILDLLGLISGLTGGQRNPQFMKMMGYLLNIDDNSSLRALVAAGCLDGLVKDGAEELEPSRKALFSFLNRMLKQSSTQPEQEADKNAHS